MRLPVVDHDQGVRVAVTDTFFITLCCVAHVQTFEYF